MAGKIPDELKPEQRSVVAALARGESVFALLPTGFGKSLCYQYPALAWGWKVVVAQPLLALLEDQARRAAELGLRALVFHSQIDSREKTEREKRLWAGDWDVLFVSPERLYLWIRGGRWDRISPAVSLLVFDEAHCFVDWRGFRPAYAALERCLPSLGKGVRILAMSATLPPEALHRLADRWGRPFVGIRAGLGRPNLFLGVYPCESNGERLVRLCSLLRGLGRDSSAVIYCGTRREADFVANFLRGIGTRARSFHAGLSPSVKTDTMAALRSGGIQIICATTAFGLGIDCARIARVLHWGPPPDLGAYWQEAGRAGRSGGEAFAFLLWNRSDALRLRFFLRSAPAEEREWRENNVRAVLEFLRTRGCRKQTVARYFGWEETACGNCDNCRADISEDGERGFAWEITRANRSEPWWIDDKLHQLRSEWPELRLIRGS